MDGAAYRSASKLFSERTGETFDYTDKPHVDYSVIMLPAGANERYADRSYLWNQVEDIEKRVDSQLAKDCILALPKELKLEQNIELARGFADLHFVSKGLVADVSIHMEDGNPHAHVYITTRRLNGNTFDKYKARDLNPEFKNKHGQRGYVSEEDYWNDKWREFQNTYFRTKGIDLEVDANFLVATVHQGRVRSGDFYQKETNRLIKEGSREIAIYEPERVIAILSEKNSVFSEKDLRAILKTNTDNKAEFTESLNKVLTHESIVALGPGDDGRNRFTTRQAIAQEVEFQENALHLAQAKRHFVKVEISDKLIIQHTLKPEQANALNHILHGADITAVVGKAGTGKSHLLRAAREGWEVSGYQVYGIALQGKAAEGLQKSADIESRTIHSLMYLVENKKVQLTNRDIIVMDEAGMTDNTQMQRVIRAVKTTGAKLVLVGDHRQLQPIGPGAPFRAIVEQIGFAEINTIVRQRDDQHKNATALLGSGNTAAGLSYYRSIGNIIIESFPIKACEALINKWADGLSVQNIQERMILAHRNADIDKINLLARDKLKEMKLLSRGELIDTTKGKIEISIGERIVFLKNDNRIGIKNGEFVTVVNVTSDYLAVLSKDKGLIKIDYHQYQDFSYGYAATVHKAQGVTVDNAYVFAGGRYWNRNMTYVAMSRHRENVYLFADSKTHRDYEGLSRNLGRLSIKDSVIDYPLSFSLRRGFAEDSVVGRAVEAIHKATDAIHDQWLYVVNYEAYLTKAIARETAAKHEAQTQARREEAKVVARYADLSENLKEKWRDIYQEQEALGMKHYQHPEYEATAKLAHEKNALADMIYSHQDKLKLAIEANSLNIMDIQKDAENHREQQEKIRNKLTVDKNDRLTVSPELGRLLTNYSTLEKQASAKITELLHTKVSVEVKAALNKEVAILNDKKLALAYVVFSHKPLYDFDQTHFKQIYKKDYDIERAFTSLKENALHKKDLHGAYRLASSDIYEHSEYLYQNIQDKMSKYTNKQEHRSQNTAEAMISLSDNLKANMLAMIEAEEHHLQAMRNLSLAINTSEETLRYQALIEQKEACKAAYQTLSKNSEYQHLTRNLYREDTRSFDPGIFKKIIENNSFDKSHLQNIHDWMHFTSQSLGLSRGGGRSL